MERSHGYRHGRREHGVTLIEQIMVIAIMTVLAGVAAPPLHALLSRNRLQTAQMDFIAALQYARGSAALSGVRTVFCPTRDGARCSDETQWNGGWLLGTDSNHDNQPDAGPLRVGGSYPQLTILSSAGRHRVSFLPDGSAGGSNLTLVLCQSGSGQDPLRVVVSNAGRVRGARATTEQAAACANAT